MTLFQQVTFVIWLTKTIRNRVVVGTQPLGDDLVIRGGLRQRSQVTLQLRLSFGHQRRISRTFPPNLLRQIQYRRVTLGQVFLELQTHNQVRDKRARPCRPW